MSGFDLFVGIDWSGARGRTQKGIAVATAAPGEGAPALVPPPAGRWWSRGGVIDWLADTTRRRRVLAGFDFAFGFPAIVGAPPMPSWEDVDTFCGDDPDLYGGRFFDGTHHDLRDFTFGRSWKGGAFDRRARRRTEEQASRVRGAAPSSPFLAIGPAQVGPSSVSGMRALVRLRASCGDRIRVWPFDEVRPDASVVVEIFPRYFACRLCLRPAMREQTNLDAALLAYGSAPFAGPVGSEDAGDALLSAAALRRLADDDLLPPTDDPLICREGWIFGVPFPQSAA